jgi:glycosyltransferase involved in cell wall biosynthesis
MDSPTRLTIGMPVYNAERYLSQALDSILSQRFENYQILISDNNSTDQTKHICQAYADRDPRIVYLQQKRNVGAAYNFNFLVEKASTPYFRWACHDDILEPDCLEACVSVLDDHPDVVLAYTDSVMIDDHGIPWERDFYQPNMHLMHDEPHIRFQKYMWGYLQGGMCNPLYGVHRTEVLARTGLIRAYPASDLVLLGEIALSGKVYKIEEPHFLRRYHQQSSTVANKTDEAIAAWFDSTKKAPIVCRYSQAALGYLAAIRRTLPVSREQFRCLRVLLMTYLRTHRSKLMKEFMLWLRHQSAKLRPTSRFRE